MNREEVDQQVNGVPTRVGTAAAKRRPSARALEFLSENGMVVFLSRALTRPLHLPRNFMLGRRLGAKGFRVGRMPRILGLNHITVGAGFAAGDSLWLEAVTRYGNDRFTPAITIGNNVGMGDNVHIGCTTAVSIEDEVLVGSRVTIIDHNHGIYGGAEQSLASVPPGQRPLSSGATVTIGKRVWIGDGAVILPGAQIGHGAIIGANAVVTGIIPADCIAVGLPAHAIRRYDVEAMRWVEWQ